MDFYVYDNIYTFNKLHPFSGVRNTRLVIDTIDIPENNSFWFHTDMQHIEDNVNINKRYVHIHPGVGTTNTPRFKKKPFPVERGSLYYNMEEKRVEVRKSILPFKKPLYAKRCKYYGAKLPKKRMTILGEWYYDFSNSSIHFIIDYNMEKIKFHWEDVDDQPTMAELLAKESELELKIAEAERLISEKNADRESDL